MSEDIFQMMEADAKAKLERAPSEAESSKITALGQELAQIESRLIRGEALMKELNARKQAIMTKDLVDAMDAIGQDVMGLPDQNLDIVVGTKYRASLPAKPKPEDEFFEAKAERRRKGLQWLRDDGHDGVINTEVVLTFPRGMDQAARQIAAEMQDRAAELERMDSGISFTVDIDESVPWATLTKLVKSLTEDHNRTDLPLDLLGATIFRIAEIKARKKSRSK